MVFSERNLEDDKCPELLCTMRSADAHVIVYSIADYSSFQYATRFLKRLSARVIKPTILVGNKTDLVRLRTVTTSEGCSLARQHGCKFIETSACLNYHVDDLLVGVLTQIRLNNCGGKQYQEKPTSISLKMEWKAAYSRRKETFSRAFLKSCLNSHEGVKIYT
ncbi:GTP-binding protein GEM-like [Tachypleus tridentatus]|uniref:GTP-binding protein GEM-like n=1 Tax=Tachypleus tridentatus TaxID=6853 RepID=UPI003FCF95DF